LRRSLLGLAALAIGLSALAAPSSARGDVAEMGDPFATAPAKTRAVIDELGTAVRRMACEAAAARNAHRPRAARCMEHLQALVERSLEEAQRLPAKFKDCVAHVDWHCAANRRFVPTTCCFRRSMRLRSTRGLRRCRA
jgi:hypothetical protein